MEPAVQYTPHNYLIILTISQYLYISLFFLSLRFYHFKFYLVHRSSF